MNSTMERIMWGLVCMCMLALAVNHTAYAKGWYVGTWILLGVVYMSTLLALRPNYRATCWKAIKYGVAASLPMLVPVVAVAVGVWLVHNLTLGWFLFMVVAAPIVWALGVASDMQSRTPHHDSRPGSYYYESNKKK